MLVIMHNYGGKFCLKAILVFMHFPACSEQHSLPQSARRLGIEQVVIRGTDTISDGLLAHCTRDCCTHWNCAESISLE